MPPLNEENQPMAARYVYKGFAFLRFLETTAVTLLLVVTLLALMRVLFHVACAVRHLRRERDRRSPGGWFSPTRQRPAGGLQRGTGHRLDDPPPA